jgi:hypothetical protein
VVLGTNGSDVWYGRNRIKVKDGWRCKKDNNQMRNRSNTDRSKCHKVSRRAEMGQKSSGVVAELHLWMSRSLSYSTQVAEQPIIEVELLVEMNWGAHRFIVCIKRRCMWKMWDFTDFICLYSLVSWSTDAWHAASNVSVPQESSGEFFNVRLHRLQVSVLSLGQINECYLTHASSWVQALPWFEICAWGR